MKKAIFIAVLGAASVASTYAQGILFNNYVNSIQTTGIVFASGPLAGQGVGSEFTAQAYYGAAADTSLSQLTAIGNPVTFVTSLGYSALAGGAPIGNGAGAGWFGNAQLNLPAYNTTYAMAYTWTGTYLGVTYTGSTPVVDVTTPASSSNPALNLPAALRATTFSATPTSTPEPTTLALAGLGGLASLVALRRKQS